MGCCVATRQANALNPREPLYEHISTLPSAPSSVPVAHDLDPVYPAALGQIQNLPQEVRVDTKRSSEPSLVRLNNEITHMINTFEKMHGTIGHDLTRSNTINTKRKIKELTSELSEINVKKKKGTEGMYTGNGEIGEAYRAPQKLHQENPQPEPRESFQHRRITEEPVESANNTINQSFESSADGLYSAAKIDPNGQLEASKNLLDEELVDDELLRKKEQLYSKFEKVENNLLKVWQILDTQPLNLTIENNQFVKGSEEYYSAISSITFFHDMFAIKLVAYSKGQGNTFNVKIWINGTKRCLNINIPGSPSTYEVFRRAIRQLYGANTITITPCQEVYHLSGWCPECLRMDEISNKDNLWERLTENFLEGNILITFGQDTEDGTERYLTLKQVNKASSTLVVLSAKGPPFEDLAESPDKLYEISWGDFSEVLDRIYINWNPSIYSFNKKFDSSWVTCKNQDPFKNEEICLSNNPQYLIKIPKHQQDFEIRIFVDRHINTFKRGQRIVLKLFEYEGVRALDPRTAIRSLDISDRQLLSDVFIFEKSQDVDYFVLTILEGDPDANEKEICYSILFLSFIQIEVTELPLRQTILSETITSTIKSENIGMGINCPNFPHNLHYSLHVPPQSDIQILAQASNQTQFAVILLEDTKNTQDILKIDFQTVLNENISTEIFRKYGFIERQAKVQSYILVIAAYSSGVNKGGSSVVKVTANIVSKLMKRNREIQECYPPIRMKQLICRPNILKSFNIKWTKDNTGQRKRLKNTTTPIYHPVSIFTEFLKNPCVSLKLEKGKYQFNIMSEDYRKQFFSFKPTQNEERILEPPSLSIAILKLSDNEKGYKIILDDAFYVPIGYGFWTDEMSLEDGKYTIVCPRINKEIGRGTMRIRQL